MTMEKKPPRGRKITTQTSGKTPTEPSGMLARTARDAAARYRELLAHLPVGVYRTTMKGELVECNQAVADMLGFTRAEDLWQLNVNDLYVRSSDRAEHLRKLERAEVLPAEFELRRPDGTTLWVRDYPRGVLSSAGVLRYCDGILVDITAEKRVEEALRQSESDYRRLFESAHDAILVFTPDREIILEANVEACELYGFTQTEIVGMSLERLSKYPEKGKSLIQQTMQEKVQRAFETVHFRKDGTEMLIEVNAAVVLHRGTPAILSIHRDITERKRMERAIEEMALHDPLTGLPDRKLLADRIAVALAHARRDRCLMALLFLDLDGFKAVNDSWGHAVGDLLLKDVAIRLVDTLRTSDTIARIGGDEFTVLIPDLASSDAATEIARKIITTLEKPFAVEGTPVGVSASIGIAMYPADGSDEETLLRKADKAMYIAKSGGGRRCVRSE